MDVRNGKKTGRNNSTIKEKAEERERNKQK